VSDHDQPKNEENRSDREPVAPSTSDPVPPGEKKVSEQEDASRTEVAIYAFGNVEGAVANKFPETLQNILIVVAHMNPLLIGLVMGLRTLWDGIMDPIMAHISDNTKSRWGRRRPYILWGGVSRVLFLVAFIAFMPLGSMVSQNDLMEAQKFANDSAQLAGRNFDTVTKTYAQIFDASPEVREKMLGMLEGELEAGALARFIGLFTTDKDASFLTLSDQAINDIQVNLPKLEADLAERRELVASIKAEIANLEAEGVSTDEKRWIVQQTLLEKALERVAKAEELIIKANKGQAQAIAGKYATQYMLGTYGRLEGEFPSTPQNAQQIAEQEMREAGLETFDIFTAEAKPAPKPREFTPPFKNITDGVEAFLDPGNFEQRKLVLYILIGFLIFATLSTVNGAPYYALGIELSPSYNGRTQVVVYRSVMDKIAGLAAPWVPVFCFSLFFATAFDALFWVAVLVCIIGIPSTVLMFFKTRERTRATIKESGERPSLFASMWQIGRQPDFLRILFLFVFVGLTNGLFQQVGFFLNVYWVTGSALSGATLGAQVSMLAWGLTFILLPIINWACRKFQKHRVLQAAIIWMSVGTASKWWLMDPEHPEYQFLLPFFFSVGISAVYTVLPTLMADVTDLDELRHGVRREGMFGAVMGFLMKAIGTLIPLAAGAVLVIAGFAPELEYHQHPETIYKMRIMYSFIPAVMLLFALVALYRYPLTKERVAEIKAELKRRHEAEDSA